MAESRHINGGEKIVHDRLRVNKRRKNLFLNQVLLLNKLMVKYNIEGIFDLLSPAGTLGLLKLFSRNRKGIWDRGRFDHSERPLFSHLSEGCQLEPADYQ